MVITPPKERTMNIAGQGVIVAGGSSGLGAGCAQYLKSLNAKITILDRSPPQHDHFDYFIEADITNEPSLEEGLRSIKTSVRALINTAGIIRSGKLVSDHRELCAEDFSLVMKVNVLGTFLLMKKVSKLMIAQDPIDEERGVIINTSSIAASEGQIGQLAYSASKGAVDAMVTPAAKELAEKKIRVVSIAPGMMRTPMYDSLAEKVKTSLERQFLFPSRPGTPLEFAKLVGSILTNPYINGTTIRIDGAVKMQ